MRLRFEQFAPADPPNSFDPWHRISLIAEDGSVIVLFEEAMDGDEFIAWFFENEGAIISEAAPFPLDQSDSLRRSFEHAWQEHLERLRNKEIPDVGEPLDPEDERFYHYRTRHSSVFASRGMEFPEIFFGLGYHGPEISCIGAPGSWHPEFWSGPEWTWQHYPVDYPEFFAWLRIQHPDKVPPPPPCVRLGVGFPVAASYPMPNDGRDPDSHSLEEIEDDVWGEIPDNATPAMQQVYRVRTKPIASYTAEDLRVLIDQQVGLNVAIPHALVRLQHEPLLEADFYPGDVLAAVLKVSPSYWVANPSHREIVEHIISHINFPRLDADIMMFRYT